MLFIFLSVGIHVSAFRMPLRIMKTVRTSATARRRKQDTVHVRLTLDYSTAKSSFQSWHTRTSLCNKHECQFVFQYLVLTVFFDNVIYNAYWLLWPPPSPTCLHLHQTPPAYNHFLKLLLWVFVVTRWVWTGLSVWPWIFKSFDRIIFLTFFSTHRSVPSLLSYPPAADGNKCTKS